MQHSHIHIEFLGGLAPVEARGTIYGKPFFFHARWDGWGFAVALDSGIDPRGIARNDARSYYLEGAYGQPGAYEASYMSQEDAESIIHTCIQEFLHNKAINGS
jgi:hypothetical protein